MSAARSVIRDIFQRGDIIWNIHAPVVRSSEAEPLVRVRGDVLLPPVSSALEALVVCEEACAVWSCARADAGLAQAAVTLRQCRQEKRNREGVPRAVGTQHSASWIPAARSGQVAATSASPQLFASKSCAYRMLLCVPLRDRLLDPGPDRRKKKTWKKNYRTSPAAAPGPLTSVTVTRRCQTRALVFERLLRDLGITGPSRGAFTLLGPDSIYQISL